MAKLIQRRPRFQFRNIPSYQLPCLTTKGPKLASLVAPRWRENLPNGYDIKPGACNGGHTWCIKYVSLSLSTFLFLYSSLRVVPLDEKLSHINGAILTFSTSATRTPTGMCSQLHEWSLAWPAQLVETFCSRCARFEVGREAQIASRRREFLRPLITLEASCGFYSGQYYRYRCRCSTCWATPPSWFPYYSGRFT